MQKEMDIENDRLKDLALTLNDKITITKRPTTTITTMPVFPVTPERDPAASSSFQSRDKGKEDAFCTLILGVRFISDQLVANKQRTNEQFCLEKNDDVQLCEDNDSLSSSSSGKEEATSIVANELYNLSQAVLALHRDAELAHEEASTLTDELQTASTTTQTWLKRAIKAERATVRLYHQNQRLEQSLQQAQGRCARLEKEMEALQHSNHDLTLQLKEAQRQEKLKVMEQHIRGALHIHEKQLKHAASFVKEEEKKEEEEEEDSSQETPNQDETEIKLQEEKSERKVVEEPLDDDDGHKSQTSSSGSLSKKKSFKRSASSVKTAASTTFGASLSFAMPNPWGGKPFRKSNSFNKQKKRTAESTPLTKEKENEHKTDDIDEKTYKPLQLSQSNKRLPRSRFSPGGRLELDQSSSLSLPEISPTSSNEQNELNDKDAAADIDDALSSKSSLESPAACPILTPSTQSSSSTQHELEDDAWVLKRLALPETISSPEPSPNNSSSTLSISSSTPGVLFGISKFYREIREMREIQTMKEY